MNPNIFRSSLLALPLALSTFSAYALPEHSPINLSQASSLRATLTEMLLLDAESSRKLFDLKNAKGEKLFYRATSRAGMQANLWATLDPVADKAEGTSTERVYKDFKIPANENEIVVAVIDSGVDIKHEDLKGHIWVNQAELNGKPGVDDDGDGYVDDVYGWNFLGNKNGQNVGSTTLEVTRVYGALKAKKDSGVALSAAEQALFAETSAAIKKAMAETNANLPRYVSFDNAFKLLKANGLKDDSLAGLAAVTSTDPDVLAAKKLATYIYTQGATSHDITEGLANMQADAQFHHNPAFNSSSIVGDDPNNLTETGYGNNDVTGPDASHGTHVSGIIAAVRNKFGINGQGLNIKIMSVRAVPDGDERDKDVANAVRFAVDHGARVINMSFGKPYSPYKEVVDNAMKYAESKGVLLIHAAGNDGKNTETQANNFPNRTVNQNSNSSRKIETWIEVGASSKVKGADLPASFSNYGKTSVDVFAPGKDIVSTIPGNQYASFSGTSMASPETAGVAALLLEKFPNASALQVRRAILETTNQYPGLSCNLPVDKDAGGNARQVNFSELSATGGTVNAYNAMTAMGKF